MNKIKSLSNQIYLILEEDDQLNDIIQSMTTEILGSAVVIEDDRLHLNNQCFLMRKELKESTKELIFKKAKVRDAKEVARIINKGMVEVPNTIEYKKRFVETLIIGEFNEFYLIYDEKTLIGVIEICLEEEIPMIQSIVVSEKYRGQGYGKRIMQEVENLLHNRYQEVEIVVSDHNPIAYHLYEQLGYSRIKTIMYYYERRLS